MADQQKTASVAPSNAKTTAIVSLLSAAVVWGLIWYPYRFLETYGFSGVVSMIMTYAIALITGLVLWHKKLRGVRISFMLCAVALAAGACNLGYVMAALHGEVTRIMLLFYLSPLWTIFLARLVLGEAIRPAGIAVIALSLLGACTMLWRPESGLPWPKNVAEWIALGAGMFFAINNVLIKKTVQFSLELKSLAAFSGVIVLSALVWPFYPAADVVMSPAPICLIVIIGVTLVFTNMIVQYGISHTRAGQAIVIMLFELVVASASAWWLVGESMGPREWLGGALIVSASLLSIRLEQDA